MGYMDDLKMAKETWALLNDVCFDGELPQPMVRIGGIPYDAGDFSAAACYMPGLPAEYAAMKAAIESGELDDPGSGEALAELELGERNGVIVVNWDDMAPQGPETKYCHLCSEMLHEMTHQWCHVHGIKDCSPLTQWHNEAFRDAAEAHGLRARYSENWNGWQMTDLHEATVVKLYKAMPTKAKKKQFLGKSMRGICERYGYSFDD